MNRRELFSGVLGLVATSHIPSADPSPTLLTDATGGTRGIIFSTQDCTLLESTPENEAGIEKFNAGIKEFLEKCGMSHVQFCIAYGVTVTAIESRTGATS